MNNTLRIAYAGTMPYYENLINLNKVRNIRNIFFDYRNFSQNSPLGKMPDSFLKGLKNFQLKYPSKAISVMFWGHIAPEISKVVSSMELQSIVSIDGFMSKEESYERLEKADLVLLTVALGVNGNQPFSIPGKVFDYLKMRKPILALVEPSHCKDLLEESGLAICIDPNDPIAISEVLNDLHDKRHDLLHLYTPNEELLNSLKYEALFKKYLTII